MQPEDVVYIAPGKNGEAALRIATTLIALPLMLALWG
jgi:hypothetical protein